MASRSTLGADQHSIPLFYACYLLRSIKTKSSRSTYVGSTPDPPRRIRQHNGELTQGAYKTRRGRPWVMTMIVHGFPSKLAALQFEWAWQHPYMSRHLRASQTRQGKETSSQIFKRDSGANLLKTKILAARTMLPISPYNTWPLHVKIFTEEAKALWDEVQEIETNEPLPKGLTVSVELEGVDGKLATSVHRRHGARTGPIEVKDTEFNSSHIDKYRSLVTQGAYKECSVCSSEINVQRMDHLRVALCPEGDCTAISHLDCLAQAFLQHPSNPPGLIPRGGVCESCNQYTLWGDVIRGCYRRARGGLQQPTLEPDLEEENNEYDNELGDELSNHLENLEISGSSSKATEGPTVRATITRKSKSSTSPRVTKRGSQRARTIDSDVEDFTAKMDAINCDTEDSEPGPLRKNRGAATSRQRTPKFGRVEGTRVSHDKPRDMDEIVRQALENLSVSTPIESRQVYLTKSSRAKPPTAAKKPQKSAKAGSRVEVASAERSRINSIQEKQSTATTAPKASSRKRRTPSPEYIDIDGI